MMFCPVLLNVGTGTFMLNEFGPKSVVIAAPEETTLVVTAAIVPEVGIGMVFPPEMLRLFPLMLKLGVEEMV